jgi:hypothetical protein
MICQQGENTNAKHNSYKKQEQQMKSSRLKLLDLLNKVELFFSLSLYRILFNETNKLTFQNLIKNSSDVAVM